MRRAMIQEAKVVRSETEMSVGERVRHKVFGEGTITGIDDKAQSYLVRFDSLTTDRRIRFDGKLERVV
ncbi:MAG: hypothetical protein MJZ38_00740 [archaeon]|nr:hypothetical protein [archaeon]